MLQQQDRGQASRTAEYILQQQGRGQASKTTEWTLAMGELAAIAENPTHKASGQAFTQLRMIATNGNSMLQAAVGQAAGALVEGLVEGADGSDGSDGSIPWLSSLGSTESPSSLPAHRFLSL